MGDPSSPTDPRGRIGSTIEERVAASDDWIDLGEKTAVIPPDGRATVRFEVDPR